MKGGWDITFFLSTLGLFALINAQTDSSSTDTIPTCALYCLTDLIPKSNCSLTDIPCVCSNVPLDNAITVCVRSNCNIRQQLTFAKYSMDTCNARTVNKTKIISIAGLTGGGLAGLAFFLRIAAKIRGASGQLGLDDLCLLGAVLLTIPFTTFSPILANLGLGKDIWEVSFDNITQILYIYYWDEILYATILPMTKISILFFYLRVFSNSIFRKIVYFVMALNVGYCLAFILITVFQCKPITGAWTRWDGTFDGKCQNVNMQGWMSGAITIFLDIFVLVLPLPLLARLGLSRRKKVHVFLMFSVGFILTAVSIVRLRTLVQFANTTNLTQDYGALGYWSTIEIHLGIICACMPAIRQLLRNVFPHALGSTALDSSATTNAPSSGCKRLSSPMPVLDQYMQAPELTLSRSEQTRGKRDSRETHASDHPLMDLECSAKNGVGTYRVNMV